MIQKLFLKILPVIARAILVVLLFPSFSPAAEPAGPPTPESLYQKILKEGGLSEKTSLGKKLGLLQTPEAKKALIRLMEEDHYWDRLAAVAGLSFYQDPEVVRLLADKFANDHMIDDSILPLTYRNPEIFAPFLIEAYWGLPDGPRQKEVLQAIGKTKTTAASNFLLKVVSIPGESIRPTALKTLVDNFPGTLPSLRGKINDLELRDAILSLILKSGGPEDLPLFLKLASEANAAPTTRVLAYEAVSLWGDSALKTKTCVGALKESEETLILGALYGFRTFTNDSVFTELCRLTRRGSSSKIRLLAAENLLDYGKPEGWPYLISVLKESYTPSGQPRMLDIFVSAVTFGISAVFQKLSASATERDFYSQKNRIMEALSRQTGARPGKRYEDWLSWALSRGMTVDNHNLIQVLWDGDKSRRENAVLDALRLLGFGSKEIFLKGRTLNDTELRLELARLLEQKGVLQTETW